MSDSIQDRRFVTAAEKVDYLSPWTLEEWFCRDDIVANQELLMVRANLELERRAEALEGALSRAITAVEHEDGTDPKRWSWGRSHRLVYEHPFAPVLPPWLARRLAFGPVALPGEWHTLDVAGFSLRGESYGVRHIPSARFIVDLARPDASRLVLPLGQSGQLFDRHARDQFKDWSSGRDFPLPYTSKAVDAAKISALRLIRAE